MRITRFLGLGPGRSGLHPTWQVALGTWDLAPATWHLAAAIDTGRVAFAKIMKSLETWGTYSCGKIKDVKHSPPREAGTWHLQESQTNE